MLRLIRKVIIIQAIGLQLGGWALGKGLTTPHRKRKTACYEMLHMASELAGSCEHGNEPSGSIKDGKYLD